MNTSKIVRLASRLAAAYKEIPYKVLYGFLLEQTEKHPHDAVLQHMGKIIESRSKAQPAGTMYVKDLDALIGELSSYGDTSYVRNIFGSYLQKLNEDDIKKMSSETFIDDIRDPKDAKREECVDGPIVEKFKDVKASDVFSEYKVSHVYDASTVAHGANIVKRIVSTAFETEPTRVVFAKDVPDGIKYDVYLSSPNVKTKIAVCVEKTGGGFHLPTEFSYVDKSGEEVLRPMSPTNVSNFMNGSEASNAVKAADYDASWLKMSYPEIRSELLKRASMKDYNGAEEAMNVIKDKYPAMLKGALDDYQQVLMLYARAENKQPCVAGCPFYEPASEKSSSVRDYCKKLRASLDKIVKAEDRSCQMVDRVAKERIAGFSGTISTSKVRMT